MTFIRGLNVVFGQAELTDKLFEEIPKLTSKEANTYWWRKHPIQWLPKIPRELLDDPILLKRIIFYYEDLQKLREVAKLIMSMERRQRRDTIIIDRPPIHTKGLAALLAIMTEYGNCGKTAVVILPDQTDLKLTATLYTTNLWTLDQATSLLTPLL